MSEQYLIDQMVLHIGLYKKYQYKENEIGFYQNLEVLRVLKGLSTTGRGFRLCYCSY